MNVLNTEERLCGNVTSSGDGMGWKELGIDLDSCLEKGTNSDDFKDKALHSAWVISICGFDKLNMTELIS
jgi:hypothetical protein